jgi:hypothetical protein
MLGSNSETQGEVLRWLRQQYSVGPIITLHSRITAREYVDRLGSHVHSMIQTLFPNNDGVLQDENAPIHTAATTSLGSTVTRFEHY